MASASQPFTHANILFYKGKSLDTITQCEILCTFGDLRADLFKTACGSIMLELVDVSQNREYENQDIFSLLLLALENVDF